MRDDKLIMSMQSKFNHVESKQKTARPLDFDQVCYSGEGEKLVAS